MDVLGSPKSTLAQKIVEEAVQGLMARALRPNGGRLATRSAVLLLEKHDDHSRPTCLLPLAGARLFYRPPNSIEVMAASGSVSTSNLLQPHLRAACEFCRRRKIKCSGESSGCEACRAREQACCYQATAPMGRPKKNYAPPAQLTLSGPSAGSLGSRRSGRGRGSIMSTVAASVASGEAAERELPDIADELTRGMIKLRLSEDSRTAFQDFKDGTIGTMVHAYYGLVSSSSKDAATAALSSMHPYRVPHSSRFLWELAIQMMQANRNPSPGAQATVKQNSTMDLWDRFPRDIFSMATAGIPSDTDSTLGETLLVKLLREDESVAFSAGQSIPDANPLEFFPKAAVTALCNAWFARSPMKVILNQNFFMEELQTDAADPALLALILGSTLAVMEREQAAAGAPTSPRPTSKQLLQYAEAVLLRQSAESAVQSLATAQALFLFGAIEAAQHRVRRSWALMSSARAVCRERLRRLKAAPPSPMSLRKSVEDELLLNVAWSQAMFASWSYLSLDLPRSTLIDLVDSLPLPPASYVDSAAYRYQQHEHPQSPHDASLQLAISSLGEACRILSLVVTVSVKNLQQNTRTAPPLLTTVTPPLPAGEMKASVARWLVDQAEQFVDSRTTVHPATSNSKHRSPFLAVVYATMALHHVQPFDRPIEGEISSDYLSIVVSALVLVAKCTKEKLDARQAAGQPLVVPASENRGLLRVASDALPYCLRLLDHLADRAKLDADTYQLIFEKQHEISRVLEAMILFDSAGLTRPEGLAGVKRVELSLEKTRSKTAGKRAREPSPPTSPEAHSRGSSINAPSLPALPSAGHFHSLSAGGGGPPLVNDAFFSFSGVPAGPSLATNFAAQNPQTTSMPSRAIFRAPDTSYPLQPPPFDPPRYIAPEAACPQLLPSSFIRHSHTGSDESSFSSVPTPQWPLDSPFLVGPSFGQLEMNGYYMPSSSKGR